MEENTTNQNANLLVSKEEASQKIKSQIDKGKDIIESSKSIRSERELKECRNQYYKWSDFNTELLKTIRESQSYLLYVLILIL